MKDEIEKKSNKNRPKKRLGLTCQTCNLGHKTMITQWKTNWNKLQISISNYSNIEGWDYKKKPIKKNNIKTSRINPPNSWPESSEWDNFIEKKNNLI